MPFVSSPHHSGPTVTHRQRRKTGPVRVRLGHIAAAISMGLLSLSAAATTPDASVLAQAQEALRQNAFKAGMSASDVAEMRITDAHRSAHNGVNHVYVRQYFDGLPVVNGVANLNLNDQGVVYSLNSAFAANLSAQAAQTQVRLNPAQALAVTAKHLDIPLVDMPLPLSQNSTQSQFSGGSLSQDVIEISAAYFITEQGLRRVWETVIRPHRGSDWWHLWVDAENGQILGQVNWTAEASYRVFALPKESPLDGPRTLEVDVADTTASPFGWHDTDGNAGAEFTDTRGNNVSAQEDADANNSGGRRPDGGPSLTFDFPLDLNTQAPPQYEDFAITNLFYWNNIVHDVLYLHGFDEASGNFQQNNYGRGGVGNDAVRAEAQDGSATNNANFSTPPDGSPGRMQMFQFTPPGALDISAPAAIAATYFADPAQFGAALTGTGLNGNLALVDDGSANPSQGCGALVNFPSSMIAVIDRGGCEFGVKALNAENAGAIGVIVINNEPGNATIGMAPGAVGDQVTVPSVMIGNDDGSIIRAEFTQTVNGTIRLGGNGGLNRDSDLDAGVIVHEYGHGVSNRLTGGPSNASCLFGSQQAGEGWSDFLSLVFTAVPADTADTPRGVGRYVIFREDDPLAGIRAAPYTRDQNINSLTYADIITAGQAGSPISIPHGVGTVFATALWDMYWNLVDKHGFDPDLYQGDAGNQLALRLVLDGLKMQACGPTFLDARDAILLADEVNNNGANQCEIWNAFANRGMGFSATDGGSSNSLNVTEAFDLPESCGDRILFDGFEAIPTP